MVTLARVSARARKKAREAIVVVTLARVQAREAIVVVTLATVQARAREDAAPPGVHL